MLTPPMPEMVMLPLEPAWIMPCFPIWNYDRVRWLWMRPWPPWVKLLDALLCPGYGAAYPAILGPPSFFYCYWIKFRKFYIYY